MNWTLKQACFQGYPESTVYVQVSIGSRNSAIHNAYHSSLRPSSLFEPRHRSLKVVNKREVTKHFKEKEHHNVEKVDDQSRKEVTSTHPASAVFESLHKGIDAISILAQSLTPRIHSGGRIMRANDPSAGSPTETLLRLLLPLSDKVH